MNAIEMVAYALEAPPDLLRFLPELLADLDELGSDAAQLVSIVRDLKLPPNTRPYIEVTSLRLIDETRTLPTARMLTTRWQVFPIVASSFTDVGNSTLPASLLSQHQGPFPRRPIQVRRSFRRQRIRVPIAVANCINAEEEPI